MNLQYLTYNGTERGVYPPPMSFKTKPHRYTIGPAPTSRARCRRCKRPIERGALRLAIHAFVRPNRSTTFARHLSLGCIGVALAADVLRARDAAPTEAQVDVRVSPAMAAHAWALVEAQAGGGAGVDGRLGDGEGEVGTPNQAIVSTMFGNHRGV